MKTNDSVPTPTTELSSDDPRAPHEFLLKGKAAYVGTPMEDAKEALELLHENVQPILIKLEETAEKGAGATWIKSQEAHLLLEWIITILNHSQILQLKTEAAEVVMGQMNAEIKRLNDGKGLWTPGSDAP